MTRNERILVAVCALVVGGFIAVFALGVEDKLGVQSWFSNGANVIQWISGPATLAAVVTLSYRYLVCRCAVPWCPRTGEHPVEGCLKKVCTKHHTSFHHELVHGLHAAEHAISGRLHWGQSHHHPTIAERADERAQQRQRTKAGSDDARLGY